MKRHLNTKKILIFILVFTSSYTIIGLPTYTFGDIDDNIEFNFNNKEERSEDKKDGEVKEITKKENNNELKSNKKILKKEIQKRKKLHKSLLEAYNKNFDKELLNSIINNGIVLDGLKIKYSSFSKDKEIFI